MVGCGKNHIQPIIVYYVKCNFFTFYIGTEKNMTTLIDGLSLGSIYALIALGYTMVYGIAKMLNFAHGDIIMVGAYSVFLTLVYSDLYVLAVIFSIVVCVVLGVVVERVAYKPLRGASPLAVLITAIGVSNLLQSIAQLAFESKSTHVLSVLVLMRH